MNHSHALPDAARPRITPPNSVANGQVPEHDARHAVLGGFDLGMIENDLGPYLFLQSHLLRRDTALVRRQWRRELTVDVLPERARTLHTIDAGTTSDILVEVDDVLVLLRTWQSGGDAWASASAGAAAQQIVAEIEGRLRPVTDERSIDACFADNELGFRYRALDIRPWQEISHLYAPDTRAALDALMGHRPSAQEARRLVVWHGAPGTGKTSAIRALLHAWREWADGTVVADPQALLSSGKYLRRVVLDEESDDRWRVIVLEDAEDLLHRSSGSAGLSKLLNLSDGLLGQGLRCLFLLTTNEAFTTLHPALVRPGRCLARIEFGALPAGAATRLLGRPVDRAMTLAEVMSSQPVSADAAPVAVGQYL